MATTGVLAGEGMSVGRVYQRAFATMVHNPVATLGPALILGALPGLLVTWLGRSIALSARSASSSGFVLGTMAVALLGYLAMLVLNALVQGALTRATVAESQGRRASVGECFAAAAAVAVPLVALVILWSLGILAAFLFFLVPALILLSMWAVAVPVMVEERVGIGAAFGRSRALTKGDRWKVLGVLLIFIVVYYLLFTVMGLFVGAAGLIDGSGVGSLSPGFAIMTVVTGTLFNALWGTLAPSMYVDLRNAKEGGSMHDLAEVFA